MDEGLIMTIAVLLRDANVGAQRQRLSERVGVQLGWLYRSALRRQRSPRARTRELQWRRQL